jgi:hypothetical protein
MALVACLVISLFGQLPFNQPGHYFLQREKEILYYPVRK